MTQREYWCPWIPAKQASGLNGIPTWILKEYASLLCGPVCWLFNSILRNGYVQDLRKPAEVCPIPKVPSPSLIEKHLRPIPLTAVLCKLLEGFISGWIMNFTEDSLDPHQFGWLRDSSTTHPCWTRVHQWKNALDKPSRMVRVLMLDFSKAFNRIDHIIVLEKLANLGLPNFIMKWMTSFLCQSKQRVRIGQYISDWRTINAGVSQGTLCSSVCFLLHITTCKRVVQPLNM